MNRIRLAIFDFAGCEGCQLQIVDMEEQIRGLLDVVEPVEWREAISDHSDHYDVALVEGSITRPQDEQRLREIRQHATVLVALGACAVSGGVNKLKNDSEMHEIERCVYGRDAAMPHLASSPAKALDEVVKVDFKVPGCPVSADELGYIVRCLALGTTPVIPNYPVCTECKMRESVCRYECGEVCLGVITRAGCNAPCPAGGSWCYGCRGLVDDPNINAAHDVMARYGMTVEQLMARMRLFNAPEAQACIKH
jgi:coenzyme F420-reducing hydrogenase gamma subunit